MRWAAPRPHAILPTLVTLLAEATAPDLVAAFGQRKIELCLSDAALGHRTAFTTGHADKVLGSGFAREWFRCVGGVLDALAVDLVMIPNPEKLARCGEVELLRQSHYTQSINNIQRGGR